MKVKTLHEIHDEGINALRKTLGPVDMVRFIQMFDHGKVDYTKERKQWLPDNPDEVKERLLKRQKKIKKQ